MLNFLAKQTGRILGRKALSDSSITNYSPLLGKQLSHFCFPTMNANSGKSEPWTMVNKADAIDCNPKSLDMSDWEIVERKDVGHLSNAPFPALGCMKFDSPKKNSSYQSGQILSDIIVSPVEQNKQSGILSYFF